MTDSSPPAGADQQPVAHMHSNGDVCVDRMPADVSRWPIPLFASPAAAPAVLQTELTDERIEEVWTIACAAWTIASAATPQVMFARAIEREVRSMLAASPTQAGEQPAANERLLIGALQSLLDRMANDPRTGLMFEGDGDTIRDAITYIRRSTRARLYASTEAVQQPVAAGVPPSDGGLQG